MEFERSKEGKIISVKVSTKEIDEMSDKEFCDFVMEHVEHIPGDMFEYIEKRIKSVVERSTESVKSFITNVVYALTVAILKSNDESTGLQDVDFDSTDISYAAMLLIEMIKKHNIQRGAEIDEDTIISVKQIQHCVSLLIGEPIIELEY